MARRKGRPRRAAQAPKEGPDRKSLVKYVEDSLSSVTSLFSLRVRQSGDTMHLACVKPPVALLTSLSNRISFFFFFFYQ